MNKKTKPKWTYQAIIVEVKDGDTIAFDINLASFSLINEINQGTELVDLGFSLFVSQDFLPLIKKGASIWHKNESIRLFGLNAPEKSTEKGKEVARFVKELLPVDSVITLETIRVKTKTKQDKYGRYLGKVYLPDGRCLNYLLLEQGLAVSMIY